MTKPFLKKIKNILTFQENGGLLSKYNFPKPISYFFSYSIALITLLVTLFFLFLLLSIPYVIITKLISHKSMSDIYFDFFNIINKDFQKGFFGMLLLGIGGYLIGTLHYHLLKKEGKIYKLFHLISTLLIVYVLINFFIIIIDGLIQMYTGNSILFFSIIISLIICIYFFLIKKDIIK